MRFLLGPVLFAPSNVNWHSIRFNKAVRSAIGAALAVLVGLVLWKSHWGNPLVNYSYDGLWVFGTRSVTNPVTFIMMDTESFTALHQNRGTVWDRGLHARLLNKLAVDNCSIVVMDVFFGQLADPKTDEAAARAMKRHHEIALRAGAEINGDELKLNLPSQPFLSAVGTNWGLSHFAPDTDGIVRRHWPFPSPGQYPTLAEVAAQIAGAKHRDPGERWLRYYGEHPAWTRINYLHALKEPPNFFHDQIVFVGIEPKTLASGNYVHKYRTPYTHWTGECYPGTEMLMTEFLNLLNHEALRRSARLDFFMLLLAGGIIGGVLGRLRFKPACIVAIGSAIVVTGASVGLTAMTNYWFPWLLVIIGQLPIALVWSAVASRDQTTPETKLRQGDRSPKIPGYRLIEPPFGRGAYGKVWLGQDKSGQWRAIKVVSADEFDSDPGPYEREYEGVSRYRHVCDKHPGLLRVEFVSEKSPAQFYYVMELGDALEPGWEDQPTTYKPRDLNLVRSLAPQKRIPLDECLRIGMALTDTLDFLHRSGFTHRDIKPQNILFVKGQPKLADLGLITNVRTMDSERTAVGTPGYMPPPPEMPGTPQADIYALGMVLYVISTGRSPVLFPELSATLLGEKDPTEFFLLNSIVLKACQLDPEDRYASAREMYDALAQLKSQLAV